MHVYQHLTKAGQATCCIWKWNAVWGQRSCIWNACGMKYKHFTYLHRLRQYKLHAVPAAPPLAATCTDVISGSPGGTTFHHCHHLMTWNPWVWKGQLLCACLPPCFPPVSLAKRPFPFNSTAISAVSRTLEIPPTTISITKASLSLCP